MPGELQLTIEDRRMLREMDAAFQPHAKCDARFNAVVNSYQRLDAECARTHRAVKRWQALAHAYRAQRNVATLLFLGLLSWTFLGALVKGVEWVLRRIG